VCPNTDKNTSNTSNVQYRTKHTWMTCGCMRHERCVSISRCSAGLAALTRGSSLTATGVEVLPDDSSASTMTPLAPRCSSRMVRSPAASWRQGRNVVHQDVRVAGRIQRATLQLCYEILFQKTRCKVCHQQSEVITRRDERFSCTTEGLQAGDSGPQISSS
jgi:hypothetical protein